MKLKTSVAAVILAFSATGAWAGPSGTDNAASDLGSPDSTAEQPSAGPVNEELQWKFVNGTGAQDSEQSAKSEDQDGDQAARSEEEGSEDQAASSGQESDSDQAATSEEQEGNDQAATSESEDSDEQSAMTDDEEDSNQAANEDEGGDQSANAEEQGDEEQSARSEAGDENDQSANSDQPAADLKDKVVVIIPKGWKGSISALITALESSPDAKDIVVVQQGDPQASNDGPDDSYSASQKPVINQQ